MANDSVMVEGFLHHVKNLGLIQSSFFADAHYEISFGQGHFGVLSGLTILLRTGQGNRVLFVNIDCLTMLHAGMLPTTTRV